MGKNIGLLWVAITYFLSFQPERLQADAAYVQVSSLITQTPTSGKGSPVKMESIDAIKNMEFSVGKDKLTINEPGIYLAIGSGQVGATNPGATGYVDCWFNKNGQPLPNSTSRVSVDTSTSTGLLVTQFIINLVQGDVLEVFFSASGPSLGFVAMKPEVAPSVTSFTLSMIKLE